MKKILILLLLICSLSVSSQSIRKVNDTVYTAVRIYTFDSVVGRLVTADGNYQLLRSKRGVLYYYKLSKNNKFYKVYPKITL